MTDDVKIGDGSTVDPFVVLKNGTEIGRKCHIRSGARIGAEAFDFRVGDKGIERNQRFQSVIVEDGCDIGHNVVIQVGVEKNTRIGRFTLINNLSNIGHDITIGERCSVGLSCSMSGHSELGDGTELSPGVTIINRAKLGREVTVGIGSLVLHDVTDGDTILGRPAVNIDRYKHERGVLRKLYGGYKPSRIVTNRRRLSKVLKRFLRRFF